jgi:hypothetical protein
MTFAPAAAEAELVIVALPFLATGAVLPELNGLLAADPRGPQTRRPPAKPMAQGASTRVLMAGNANVAQLDTRKKSTPAVTLPGGRGV